MPQADVLLTGRYRLARLIGRGGMAEVWAARDEVLERDVAVKLLSARFRDDAQFTQRFRREAQQAAQLNHPNVVQVYDTGRHAELPYIVMELVRGRSLQQVLEHGGLTEERSLEICADVCAALAYAHDSGIVHRDVKPGNILLADDGTVKVTDFGIARAIDTETVTQTAAVLGTAAYLSPEQAQGLPVDARSDIYSLGVVLYELLTGVQPFRGDSAVGIAYQHVQEDAVPPRTVDPSVSPAAEAVAVKAMAKNRSNRYGSAGDMRDDLLRARAGGTVAAPAVLLPDETAILDRELLGGRPPPSVTQVRRRRAVGYGALAVLFLAAVAGLVWFLANVLSDDPAITRAVPSVVGQRFEEAREDLEALGFEARFAGEEPSSEFPPGRIVRQDPDAGMEAEEGTVVDLVVSSGPELVDVPEVGGMAEEDAIAALRDAGLVVGDRVREFSDEVERGRVIRTEPPTGESVERGSPVTLVISAGEETEIVPDVTGLTESDARFRLQERDFEVDVVREFSDTVDEGRVIRQDPEGNEEVRAGASVTIVVSRGPQEPSPTPTPTGSPSPEESPSPSPSETETGILPGDGPADGAADGTAASRRP